MYVLNENMEEVDVSKRHSELYFAVLETYGSWKKALKLNGIGKRNLKERQKFMVYCIMKARLEKFGDESLRPKNIDEDTKQKIVSVYPAIRNLTQNVLKNWSEDKVMYELRLFLLTGGDAENLDASHPELFHHMTELFGDFEAVNDEYHERFGVRINHEKKQVSRESLETAAKKPETQQKKKKATRQPEEVIDLNALRTMGYLTEDQVNEIRSAQEVTEEQMFDFLMDEIVQARIDGIRLNEERLKERNSAMYHAVINHYGKLDNALRVAVLKQVDTGS